VTTTYKEAVMGSKSSSNGKPYIGYVRISNLGKREAGKNLSSENQRKSIDQTADQHGLKIGWWFADEDVSGQTFERAGWQQVVGLIEADQAGGIVVWNQSRASRARSWDTMAMIDAVEQAGGRIFSQAGQITVSTYEGEVMAFMNGAADNRYAVQQGEGLKQSVAAAIDRGAHLQAPYGYVKAAREAGRAMPLELNEGEAAQVKKAADLKDAGGSLRQIAAALNRSGLKPRPYRKKKDQPLTQGMWRPQTVAQMLSNEVYTGVAYNGPQRVEGAHPAIIDPALFARINQHKGARPAKPEGGYLLTGLVRCASCGYVMAHSSTNGRPYYRCLGQSAQGCEGRVSVPAEKLDEWVTKSFITDYLGTSFHADAADATVKAAEAEVVAWKAKAKAAMTAKVELAGSDADMVEIADGEVVRTRQGLAAAKRTLGEALAAARGVQLPDELDAEAFGKAPVAEQRGWLSDVYAFVVVRRDKVWRGPISSRAKLVAFSDAAVDPMGRIAAAAAVDW
jgi:hypothetical protein